jgi:hypothetical protein
MTDTAQGTVAKKEPGILTGAGPPTIWIMRNTTSGEAKTTTAIGTITAITPEAGPETNIGEKTMTDLTNRANTAVPSIMGAWEATEGRKDLAVPAQEVLAKLRHTRIRSRDALKPPAAGAADPKEIRITAGKPPTSLSGTYTEATGSTGGKEPRKTPTNSSSGRTAETAKAPLIMQGKFPGASFHLC